MRPRGTLAGFVPVLVALTALAGCSHSGSDETPAQTLQRAQQAITKTTSLHFLLSSKNVPAGPNRLTGGDGVIAKPSQFQGKLTLQLGASGTVSVNVISSDGTVYVQLPFAKGYAAADPTTFGLSDPALLLGTTNKGLINLVSHVQNATSGGEARIDNDVVVRINGQIPGAVVAQVLTDADPATPVQVVGYFAKSTAQLRRAELTGPIYVKGQNSTFNIVLDRYDEKVSISAPPTS